MLRLSNYLPEACPLDSYLVISVHVVVSVKLKKIDKC